MPLDAARLRDWPFETIEHRYAAKDAILYALSLGLGGNPLDRDELRFVYEEGLQAVPSMAVVLAYPGFWLKEPGTGVDWKRVLHGEQGLVLHRPLPPSGAVRSRTRVDALVDKGPGRGALLHTSREISDAETGEALCTLRSTTFLRGDGGFGGPAGPVSPPNPVPDRAPDGHLDMPTLPQAALLYRLNGDSNPLHADPDVAREAGFPAPILHGLATYGIACVAALRALCEGRPERLRRLDVRFSAPVFPGETIRVEFWRTAPGAAALRARVVERDAVVLNNGLVAFGSP